MRPHKPFAESPTVVPRHKLRKWVWGERDLGIMLDTVCRVREDGKELRSEIQVGR